MFKNYFKTAFRFLAKNRTFTLINMIGLAIGTLCCLYIVFYVVNQYSYDKYYRNDKDIYRITTGLTLTGEHHQMATASPPIAPAMKNNFPEVKQYTRFTNTISTKEHLIRYQDKSFYEKDMVYADSTFFDVFNFHFAYGNPTHALMEPFSVVLMKPLAEKLFGRQDPIGKLITVDDVNGDRDFKVTGVIDESLGLSSIHANIFVSMNSGGIGQFVLQDNTWAGNNFVYSFVKLYPKTNVASLDKKLPAFLDKYGEQQLKFNGMEKSLHLQPVSSIHTTPGYEAEMDKTVSPVFLHLLLLIAGLVQLIACINFMNLSTARASKRAKEVGVRKVVGAGKQDLIKQFLAESFLLSLLAVLIALPLLFLLLPYFNDITQANIHLFLLKDYRVWLGLTGLVLITTLVSGSYPAFYLSAFQAIKVLKGNLSNRFSAVGLRRSLVVFQFVISILLISAIIVIFSQMNFIKTRNLGFDKNQKLIFQFYTNDAVKNTPAFMNDLKQLPGVKDVSRANNYPSQFVFNDRIYYLAGGNPATGLDIQSMLTDEHFVNTLGIKLTSGRDFRQGDSGRILINETCARQLGLNPQTAAGTLLYFKDNINDTAASRMEIAGVMKDFNYSSLQQAIRPFMLIYDPDMMDMRNIIVSGSSNDYQAMLGKIKTIWQKDFRGLPFTYSFLDQDVQKQYESEITMSHIINAFTLIAILISCLGLFGLAAFSAEQRTKEIGIRKILGASVTGIMQLLSKDFLRLVVIAIIISVPISWWTMDKWLNNFVYRIKVSWWMFAVAGLLALLIALITVSFQAIKAAVVNPVESLRME